MNKDGEKPLDFEVSHYPSSLAGCSFVKGTVQGKVDISTRTVGEGLGNYLSMGVPGQKNSHL